MSDLIKAFQSVEGSLAAYEILLRALFAERAVEKGFSADEARDEVHSVIRSLDAAQRRGTPGEEDQIGFVRQTLEEFAANLHSRLQAAGR